VRYGVMHRNTFINSPKLLDSTFNFKADRRIYFAGQITGVEGYIESAASGILAGINMANQLENKPKLVLPKDTMLGALAGYISDETVADFQPMGCNMGILPSLDDKIKDKTKRYEAISLRALDSLKSCLNK